MPNSIKFTRSGYKSTRQPCTFLLGIRLHPSFFHKRCTLIHTPVVICTSNPGIDEAHQEVPSGITIQRSHSQDYLSSAMQLDHVETQAQAKVSPSGLTSYVTVAEGVRHPNQFVLESSSCIAELEATSTIWSINMTTAV